MAQTIANNGQKTSTVVELGHGLITTIPCGDFEIRVYNTRDAIWVQVILLVKGKDTIVLELPCFKNSIEELTKYIAEENLDVVGKLVSYHSAGSTFLPGVKSYLSESSRAYNTNGGGAALVHTFEGVFGEAFDARIRPMYALRELKAFLPKCVTSYLYTFNSPPSERGGVQFITF